MSIELRTDDQTTLLWPKINHDLSSLVKAEWFDSDFWKLKGAISGRSVGRNITWFIKNQKAEWVLRHYYRGGMVAHVLHDKYWFQGFESTRCYKELALMQQMYQKGLAVPKPIAGRVQKLGLYYRADILLEKIRDASDLVVLLRQRALSEAEWKIIGTMVAKFHQSGIYHADLNAHNILLDNNSKAWLIDFDQCENRKPERKWQQENLSRLKRSFLKEKERNQTFFFEAQNWRWLYTSYRDY